MMTRVLLYVILCVVFVSGQELTKKICKDVDTSQCNVHSVTVYNCKGAPSFCTVKRKDIYLMNIGFTSHFSADNLGVSMYADENNSGNFTEVVQVKDSGCQITTCPLEAEEQHLADVKFVLQKNVNIGKFPVQFKLWNEEDDSQVCCFTFTVRVKK